MAESAGGHIVLCGLNELGYRTLEELRGIGERVILVAEAPREGFTRGARALDAALVGGIRATSRSCGRRGCRRPRR